MVEPLHVNQLSSQSNHSLLSSIDVLTGQLEIQFPLYRTEPEGHEVHVVTVPEQDRQFSEQSWHTYSISVILTGHTATHLSS